MKKATPILKALLEELEDRQDVIDFKSGIYNISDYKKIMFEQYENGKERGSSTHFDELDPFFTWKRGFVGVFTGWPNMGKSEILLQLSCLKVIMSDWNVCGFFPENMSTINRKITPTEIADTLIHAITGKSVDPLYKKNQLPKVIYEYMIDYVAKKFTIVYPKEKLKTPDLMVQYFEYVHSITKQDLFIIDPFNKLYEQLNGRLLDRYIADTLGMIKDFTVNTGSVFTIIEHPNGARSLANDDGKLPPASRYHLRGGAMWDNACDFIISAHRPNLSKSNYNDPEFELHVQKIRNQKLVGMPGILTGMSFDRKKNRYSIFDPETGKQRDIMEASWRKLCLETGLDYEEEVDKNTFEMPSNYDYYDNKITPLF